jgi:DNA topoisomerase-1
MKCKQKREMVNPIASYTVNGKPITKGECAVCGTTVSRMGMTESHGGLEKPMVYPAAKKNKRQIREPKADQLKASKSNEGERSKKAKKSGVVAHGDSGKELVIVESPAKAKTIGKFLGNDYTVVASVGHVRDLLKSQLSVDVEHDFTPKYRVPNEKRPLVKEITQLAEQSPKVYLATDPDREGESIAWHLMDAAGIPAEKTERVVFHEITKDAINDAFAQPRGVDMDLVNAQQARRVLDRLVGYSVSPLLWNKVHGGLSAGRVQSVALRLIVEREREIQDYIPQEYWLISAVFTPEGSNKTYTASLKKINRKDMDLPNEDAANQVVKDLLQAAYQLDSIKTSQKNIKPSAPFITSTMQQDASRRLGFSAKKTMAVAQQLYEGIDIGNGAETGLITYMRTDSVHVAPQAINEARSYIKENFGDEYLPEQVPHYKSRAASAQEAHEAIRPTSVMHKPNDIKPYLTNDQYKLYNLIWKRFVASQMVPAILETTTVEVGGKSEKNNYLFRATSSKLIFNGFKAVYEEAKNEDETVQEDESELPLAEMAEGQKQDLIKVAPSQHFTQPPPRFSEASLIQVLEENKIGRPSTYSPILSTIQARGYVTVEQKRLIPTEVGFIVNDLLVEYFPAIMDISFTSEMEEQLDEIANGKMDWVDVMREFYGPFETSLAHAKENMPVTKIEPEKLGRECPQCGHELVLRNGRYGKFVSCSNFPSCRYTESYLETIGVQCPKCKTGEVVRKRTRKGRVFYGCSHYPECDFTSWNQPLEKACPNCEGTLVAQNKHHARCLNCENVYDLEEMQPQES